MPNKHLTRIIALCFVLTVAAVAATAFSIFSSREETIADTRENAGNIATVLAGQVSYAIRNVDLVIEQTLNHMHESDVSGDASFREVVGARGMHQFLLDRLARLPHADVINFFDSRGRLAGSTRGWPAPQVDVSDRDFFAHHKAERSSSLFISDPVFSKLTGAWSMYFSRRVETAAGDFLGVLLVGVLPKRFLSAYSPIASIPGASSLLLRQDGTVYLRFPDPVERVGQKMPADSEWHAIIAKGGGAYRSPGVFDTETRQVAVRPLGNYPLVVNVAMSESLALESWRQRANLIAVAATLALLTVCGLIALLYRMFNRVAETGRLLDAAVDHMPQGLIMFDASQRISMLNDRLIEMYRLDPAVIKPGSSRRDLFEFRMAMGTGPVGDPDAFYRRANDPVTDRSIQIDHLSDGRAILVNRRLIASGGWVTTHEDITERHNASRQVEHLAHHDALTDLANRNVFMTRLGEMTRDARDGATAAILVDLDGFKLVNDKHGHGFGDQLLRAVAGIMRSCVGPDDVVARLGGDEFAILCKGERDALGRAMGVAESLLERGREALAIDGKEIRVGFSIGVAAILRGVTAPEELLRHADLALYRAKSGGRNRFIVFEPAMDREFREARELTADLQLAIERGEISIHYQPIVDATTSEVRSMEALLRWSHATRGPISPGKFIRLAEECGLIGAIGDWALERACRDARRWPEQVSVAVNLSALQICKPRFCDDVRDVLRRTGLDARRLDLEVTESVLLDGNATNHAALASLRSLGVSISLDDFGTGYSSLSYLTDFAFDHIKIDKSFVDRISTHEGCAAIIAATTNLARTFDAATVAEGVETPEQFRLLRALGVNRMQGYLFGRPLPANQWEFVDGKARALAPRTVAFAAA